MRMAPAPADPHLPYRPDIDGLRAVAILSVLAFHTWPNVVRGGFIGVDVFFVISGYLISSIILRSLREDRFSLRRFYARRIRRIFPALLVVLLACFAFGWFALLADEYAQLGKHIAAGAGFGLNLVLWGESGYFDTAAALKPLLHLWSLGIEEQFYIAWPLVLWLAWKGRVNLRFLTVAIIAASFGLSVNTTHLDSVAAFYSPLTRFWELMTGCALAIGGVSPTAAGARGTALAQNLQAAGGALLIAAAVLGLSEEMSFPGWWALLPVLGAFLLVSAGPQAWLNRHVLSHRLMVGIGLISYPLYLWHWVLLAFARIRGSAETPPGTRTLLVLVSVVLAWSTYWWIERPARRGGANTVGLLVVLMIVMGSAGFYTFRSNGFDTRFPATLRAYANFRYPRGAGARPGRCWLSGAQAFTEYADECVDDSPDRGATRPLALVWGDSHAARLYVGMNAVRGERYRFAQLTRDGCPPLLGFGDQRCSEGNRFILEKIRQTAPQVVVLFADWRLYGLDSRRESAMAELLERTLAELREASAANVIVVGPAPRWEKPLPKLVYEVAVRDAPRYRVPLRMTFGLDPSYPARDAAFARLLAGQGVEYFSMRHALCNEEGCLTHVGPGPEGIVTWDHGHLTAPGAAYVAERLLP